MTFRTTWNKKEAYWVLSTSACSCNLQGYNFDNYNNSKGGAPALYKTRTVTCSRSRASYRASIRSCCLSYTHRYPWNIYGGQRVHVKAPLLLTKQLERRRASNKHCSTNKALSCLPSATCRSLWYLICLLILQGKQISSCIYDPWIWSVYWCHSGVCVDNFWCVCVCR